jgi:hypothetical protein
MFDKKETIRDLRLETGGESFIYKLSEFLSQKGNTRDSLPYKVIQLWLNDKLTSEKMDELYNSPHPASKISKILLRLAAVPRIIFMTFAQAHLPKKQRNSYVDILCDAQAEMIEIAMTKQQFTFFMRLPTATKLKDKQLEKVKNEEIASAFSDESLETAYNEHWNDINYKGERSYQVDLSENNSPVFFVKDRRKCFSPVSFLLEFNMFSRNSSPVVPVVVDPTPELPLEQQDASVTNQAGP